MTFALLLLVCLGTGTIGGVFFAFSSFVMGALAELPPAQGALAMQRINVVVLNRLFLAVFAGTAVLAAIVGLLAFFPWTGMRSFLMLAAAVSYIAGTFGVTMTRNVPRNERLARMDANSLEAIRYWPDYVREWTSWNTVRTVAALVACGCAAVALALAPK